MRINGSWLIGLDGIARPVVRIEVLQSDGVWRAANFLVDTGADCTAFHADLLAFLQFDEVPTDATLSGIGGAADSVAVETQLCFRTEDGREVFFRGRFAAFTDPDAISSSVLGRDITNIFGLIVDRRQDVVCLVSQRHSYTIVEA